MKPVYIDNFPMDELNAKVFNKEPLRPGEKIVACHNSAFVRSWTAGTIVTNQALLQLGSRKVRRFDFDKMTYVEYFRDKLRFEYEGKTKEFYLPDIDDFPQVVRRTLPPKIIPYYDSGCSRCGKSETVMSAEWKAGRKVDTKVVSIEGNTTTYETTYTDIISISASLCAECFDELAEKRLKKKKGDNLFILIASPIAVAVGVIALIGWASDFLLASLALIVVGFFGFVFSLKPIIKKEFKKDDPADERIRRSYLESFAESKRLAMKRSALWTPEEFKRLKIKIVRQ